MPDASHDGLILVEIFGEGRTDIGTESVVCLPEEGVVPILVSRLCDKPAQMRVKTKRHAHLQGKNLSQKVQFAKRQARYNLGTKAGVFVQDTDGDGAIIVDLAKGRDRALPDFPFAIGVAHPCIEAWLLADRSAILRTFGKAHSERVPDAPEALPAPRTDRANNPKKLLEQLGADSQATKDAIARKIDLTVARQRCPLSFEPFAAEIASRIRPLFQGDHGLSSTSF